MITITIAENPERHATFNVSIGETFLCSSRQPLLDAARILLAQGANPNELIAMKHAGKNHTALQARIATAAKLTVDEEGPRFRTWRPHPRSIP